MLVGNKLRAMLSRRPSVRGVRRRAAISGKGICVPTPVAAITLHVPLAMQNAIVSLAIIASWYTAHCI